MGADNEGNRLARAFAYAGSTSRGGSAIQAVDMRLQNVGHIGQSLCSLGGAK